MPKLLAYARSKHVGVILWAIWKTLADQLGPALAQFEKWGIAGLKVDFMQRDDQPVIQFYWRVCRELAARKMLVDFHGAIRAVLLTRTWPNLLTVEGVQGLEHDKWSDATEPEHDVTLPFTRMFLGPMDFTPGAMHNADRAHFKSIFDAPMSLGTRSHQLAMYVVYESPLQMLADSPSNYLAEPEAMEFLGPVPSVWDETRVLDGKLGDYVVVARRSGADLVPGRPDRLDLARAADRHQLPRRRRVDVRRPRRSPRPSGGGERALSDDRNAHRWNAGQVHPRPRGRFGGRLYAVFGAETAVPVIFGDQSAISFSVVSLS